MPVLLLDYMQSPTSVTLMSTLFSCSVPHATPIVYSYPFFLNGFVILNSSLCRNRSIKQHRCSLALKDGPGGLRYDIQKWLKEVYAPAYIANMLCNAQPSESQTWRNQFSDSEKIKVHYWWTGKVIHPSKFLDLINIY